MQANPWPRALAVVIWALVGLSAAFWGLRLGEPVRGASAAPESAPAPALRAVEAGAVVRALGGDAGATPQAAAQPQRLELLGVVAEGRQGVALIAVEGQPATPVMVGGAIGERLVLRSVAHRRAELADRATGQVVQQLQMPDETVLAAPAGPMPAGRRP